MCVSLLSLSSSRVLSLVCHRRTSLSCSSLVLENVVPFVTTPHTHRSLALPLPYHCGATLPFSTPPLIALPPFVLTRLKSVKADQDAMVAHVTEHVWPGVVVDRARVLASALASKPFSVARPGCLTRLLTTGDASDVDNAVAHVLGRTDASLRRRGSDGVSDDEVAGFEAFRRSLVSTSES